MKKIKPAATILLGRDGTNGLEVLLLKRNKALAFAGGLWVFPGGKIEADELQQNPNELAAAKQAAIRETKEEANLDININSLFFYHHWTTPVVEPRRYATYFFFAGVSSKDTKVQIDDSEIKKHIWINPQKAIKRLRAGELKMLPPTLMSLELISKCNSVAEVEHLLQQHEPLFILPVLHAHDGKMICIYEGDAAYESNNIDMEGARHRLILDIKNSDFIFEYQDCKTPPVNGGMHL